jgi:hypothetical protein
MRLSLSASVQPCHRRPGRGLPRARGRDSIQTTPHLLTPLKKRFPRAKYQVGRDKPDVA